MSAKNIVIVGGGATGWSVASLLRKQLPQELVNIQLIDGALKDVAFAETSQSAIHHFHELIGLPEKACVMDSSATFGLGLRYKSWNRVAQDYVLTEGLYGAPLDGAEFSQLFAKTLALNLQHDFDDYSLNAIAVKLGRFGHPVDDPKSIYSSIKYGLNLPLNEYAEILKRHALGLGVKAFNSDCVAVELNPIDGNISSIQLSSGEILTADIFIDCSGRASVLLGSALGVETIENELSQLFDSVAIGYRQFDTDIQTAATLTHGRYGYLKKIALKNSEVILYCFSSKRVSNDDIGKEMLDHGVVDLRFATASFNRKESFWVKNCLAIGESALSFYDTYFSALHVVRNSVVRFLDLLVDFENVDASRREYNRLSSLEFERIEELTALQFYVARSNSNIFSDYFSVNNLSSNAQHKLDLFSLTGRHSVLDLNLISESEWSAFFLGNGIFPKTYNVIADGIDKDKLVNFTERLRAVILKAAEHMPSQKDYVSKIAAIK